MVVSNIEPMTPGKPEQSAGFGAGRFGLADAHRKIQQTVNYMGTHLSQPTQVNRLAAMVNVSPSHFYALFKQCTGFAPIDFFIRLRMRRASELLETTSLSVKEVAAALGYDDPFYFSRVFKSVHKVAPSEYRNLTPEGREALVDSLVSRAAYGIVNLLPSGIERQMSPSSLREAFLDRTVASGGGKTFR